MSLLAESILLLDLSSNEKHCLNSTDHIIGRDWLNCSDKRISRNHGILKVISGNSVKIISTHENPMFVRKQNSSTIDKIEKNTEIDLFVGDSFGLLIDKFWFSIQLPSKDNGMDDVSNIHSKRRTSPFSENGAKKKTKTDSNLPQSCNSGFENSKSTSTNDRMQTDLLNNRNAIDIPSTSNRYETIPTNFIGPAHQPIKLETVEMDDNANIKTEPEESNINTINIPIKIEVKDEPIGNLTAASDTSQTDLNEPDESTHATQRNCCKYGIRCYRRNPLHRSEEAHPGDLDYRLPHYPDPPLGVPTCPYLDRCYRRNPVHFQSFSHKIDSKSLKLVNTTKYINQPDDSDEDPFATDGDSDPDFPDLNSSDSD